MPLFDGKVVIVTGGGSGIGEAACYLYAREGAKVVVSDLNEQAGSEVARAIQKEKGNASFVRADVSNPGDCPAMKVIAVNLSSVFYCMKHEIPAMLKTGG